MAEVGADVECRAVDQGRRDLLRNIAISCGGSMLVGVGAWEVCTRLASSLLLGQADPIEVAEGLNETWTDISVFAGGVVLGSSVELYGLANLHPESRLEHFLEGADHLAIRRPLMVLESAVLNDLKTKGLEDNTIGFWLPKSDKLAFAHYEPDSPIYPIASGNNAAYDVDLQKMFGEKVTVLPNRQDSENPRHFFVYPAESDIRLGAITRRKDIGQSVLLGADRIPEFIGRQFRTFGGFELRGTDFTSEQAEIDTSASQDNLQLKIAVEVNSGLQYRWGKLNVFPGVVGVSKAARVFSDPDLSESSEVRWPKEYSHAIVVRPMLVAASASLNLVGPELEGVLDKVKSTTIGFWLPGPGKFVYLDTEEYLGSILPVNRGDEIYPDPIKKNGLVGFDIELDGRTSGSIEDSDIVYPFINDQGRMSIPVDERLKDAGVPYEYYFQDLVETEDRNVVGHSVASNSGIDVVATANYFRENKSLELTHIP